MKTRKKDYGKANIVGKNIEELRKKRGISQKDFIAQIQVMGCDINPTSYSKLEGQLRAANDREIYVIAKNTWCSDRRVVWGQIIWWDLKGFIAFDPHSRMGNEDFLQVARFRYPDFQ